MPSRNELTLCNSNFYTGQPTANVWRLIQQMSNYCTVMLMFADENTCELCNIINNIKSAFKTRPKKVIFLKDQRTQIS